MAVLVVVLAATRFWRRVRVATRKYTPGCVCVCVCCACANANANANAGADADADAVFCTPHKSVYEVSLEKEKRRCRKRKEKDKTACNTSAFLGQTKPNEAEINQTQGNHISTFRAEEKQCYYYYSDDCHASWKARRDPFLLSVTLSRGRRENIIIELELKIEILEIARR